MNQFDSIGGANANANATFDAFLGGFKVSDSINIAVVFSILNFQTIVGAVFNAGRAAHAGIGIKNRLAKFTRLLALDEVAILVHYAGAWTDFPADKTLYAELGVYGVLLFFLAGNRTHWALTSAGTATYA